MDIRHQYESVELDDAFQMEILETTRLERGYAQPQTRREAREES